MWKIGIDDIERLQLEITSFCNAGCPSCERNQERKQTYLIPELNKEILDEKKIKKWFDYDFKNLETVHLCGNIDEPILHPRILDIISFFEKKVKKHVIISTNGYGRDVNFWKELAKHNVVVIWGLDGLEDTNHIYRRNLNWKRIERNFRIYNSSNGRSIWQFLVFEHNEHQVDQAKEIAEKENFKMFNPIFSNRENKIVKSVTVKNKEQEKIICKATYSSVELQKSFYVNVKGFVYPCCWMATSNSIDELQTKFGENIFLHNNLNFSNLNDIIQDEFFDTVNKNFDNINCCNRMCKQNLTDIKKFQIL